MVGQFAFIPFYKLRWYEGSPFHFTLLGLSLLFFLIALVSALRHWKSDKAGPRAARWARRNLGLLGALNLAFVVAFASIFAAGLSDIIFAVPKGLYAVLTLPLIGLALTALAAVLAVRVWRERYWTRGARLLPHRGSGGGDRLRVVPELLEPPGLPDRIEGRITSASARVVLGSPGPRRVRALLRTSADPRGIPSPSAAGGQGRGWERSPRRPGRRR